MSSELDSFRLLNRLDLSPSFTSLGLDPEMFHDGGDGGATSFNAAMSGPGDVLWLFRGEDFLGYDLRQEKVTIGLMPIAGGWANGALPGDFQVGVDSAVWGGPGVPNLTFLFRAGNFLRLDCSADPASPAAWQVVFGPYPTGKEWLRIPSTDGRPHYGPVLEPCAKLYGLREAANRVHFFTKDGRYARHNLENGEYDIAPTDTMSQFPLPASFGGRVDIAFYGAGAEAEHIFFFSRHEFAEFDIRRQVIVRAGAIEQRFPALSAFLTRPQLYLVEDYSLDTYVGPLQLGRLVSTLQVPPQSKRTSVVVTRLVTPAAIALQQNLIERSSSAAIDDFYKRLATTPASNSELSALLGAGPSAGLWAGEVDALTGARALDQNRDALLATAFAALAEQARQSSHEISQQVVDPGAAGPVTGEVLNQETFELNNSSDTTRQVEFMELVQSYETLMLLKNVRLAYTNGRDRPELFALREVDQRLQDLLVDPNKAAVIIDYLKRELARIQDSSGDMRSFLVAGTDLDIDARVKTAFVIDDVKPQQTLEIFGIVKAARSWRQPTYQTRAIDLVQQSAQPEFSAEIGPIAMAPQADIARLIENSGLAPGD
jgi:hypothetical protein